MHRTGRGLTLKLEVADALINRGVAGNCRRSISACNCCGALEFRRGGCGLRSCHASQIAHELRLDHGGLIQLRPQFLFEPGCCLFAQVGLHLLQSGFDLGELFFRLLANRDWWPSARTAVQAAHCASVLSEVLSATSPGSLAIASSAAALSAEEGALPSRRS